MEKLLNWVDERFPLTASYKAHLSEYYAPKNFNFWYFFGSLALLVLVIQIVSGIFLTMHYKPDAAMAFASVEYIMRDVDYGWLIRYIHSTGASMFFIVVYLHMYRGLIYGSYRQPRELIWLFGVIIYLVLMGEAFMGYLLPWGQMSYWGAQVIINLFAAIPFVGEDLSIWIRGDYVVGDATLNRFFAFHVIALPLVLLGLVAAHLVALRRNALAFYSLPEESVELFRQDGGVLLFANYGGQQVKMLRAAGADIGYIIPREGALAWLDCWAVTRQARDPDLAHAWINHMLSPQASEALRQRQGLGATTNDGDAPALTGRLVWLEPVEDDERRNRLWRRIVSGDSVAKVLRS